ncbi:MAG TPA: hypothetical protein VM925_20060 [Labilithrix sp.]|jgi:hypothetical protein|nr:hypothetical protein [Labilithrix sp.]
MASTLFVWPTDPAFHPDPEGEIAAKAALQRAVGDGGDVDCDSYPEARLSSAGDEPYSARFVIRVCNAAEPLSPEALSEVSRHLGCACKQALVDEGK